MNAGRLKKLGWSALRVSFLALASIVVLLLLRQHSLIYFPHRYGNEYAVRLPKGAVEINSKTSQGQQLAFYIPPKTHEIHLPSQVWTMFSGNGSVALDWSDVVARCPNTGDGFLLIEYPGYGKCEGSASPAAIEESAEKAVDTLAGVLNINHSDLEPKLNAVGHSIGCGAALNFSVHYPVSKVILLAPFTSLRDMARRSVGFPLCYLLLHNFDNRARLADLAGRAAPPQVTIFHGSDDTIIPPAMGRELASRFPNLIKFQLVPDANHNNLPDLAADQIFAAMNQ
jgi:pimeloyl-ACP methyl ester carboxylesterase